MSDSFITNRNKMKGAFYGVAAAPVTVDSFDWNQSRFKTPSQTMDIDGKIIEAEIVDKEIC